MSRRKINTTTGKPYLVTGTAAFGLCLPPACGCNTYTGCTFCPTNSPSRWQLTIAGLTNGTCSNCNDYNDTWDLCYTSGCEWESPVAFYGTNTCGSYEVFWKLRKSAIDLFSMTKPFIVEAYAGASAMTQWAIDEGSWTCCGDNVLAIQGTAGTQCATWPTNVTVSPCTTPRCESYCNTWPGCLQTVTDIQVTGGPAGAALLCSWLATTRQASPKTDCTWEYQTVTFTATKALTLIVTVTVNPTAINANATWYSRLISEPFPGDVDYSVNWSKSVSPPFDCHDPHTLSFDSESGTANPCSGGSWSGSSFLWN